jgi:hypothetical protein
VPEENPAAAVYGLVAIGAVLAAESGQHPSHLDTFLSAVLSACMYWLLHAYATLLGRRLSSTERLTPRSLFRALGHDWALMRGAALPLATLLLAWGLGTTQQDAVTLALWSVVVGILVFELMAGVREHASASELALQTAFGLVLGLSVLALRVILHF